MVADVDLETFDATRVHTVEVARWFAAEGFDVDLVSRGPDPEIPGVRYHRGTPQRPTRAQRIAGMNAVALRLLRARRGRARACYVRHYWGQTPVLAAARALGYRVVTQVDDVPYGRGFEARPPGPRCLAADYLRRAAALAMGRLADGVVAVTPEIKGLLVDEFRVPADKVEVLPNGVNPDEFAPLPRDEAIRLAGLAADARYAVFTGHFAGWVDFETMLEAFARAARDRPAARLVLVGDGPERHRVESLLDRLGIRERTTLTGFVRERERIRALVGAATVCLAANRALHRRRIGVSPLKVAEYLAAARAVAGVRLPGMEEMVDANGAGVTTAADPVALGDAIGALLDDPARADELGAAGRRAAKERYSWQSIVRRTIPLFRDAAAGGASQSA